MMLYNFKPSYSIVQTYVMAIIPIAIIIIIMCVTLFQSYQQSVEEDKNMQMKNAVQLRITDIESWLNNFFEIESNFNTSINSFGLAGNNFNSKLFRKYITQKLTETSEISSFWI